MKKIIFTLFASLLVFALFSQQVPREKVVVEIATGTWCTYCPGAAMGADDLVANGCEVANIEYHNGDAFATTQSDARNSYYAVSGYPTAHFDGVEEYVGGSHTQSMYSNYLPLYNTRIAIPSDFTIDIYGQNTGLNYTIDVLLEEVNAYAGTNLVAHLVITESEIAYSWQGQSELNYVMREMYPDQNGTALDFSSNPQQQLTYNFAIDASWVTQHCELVAFIQDNDTKEILQGSMVELDNLQPMQATAGFSASDTTTCEGGSINFTDGSLGIITSYEWHFEGGNPATSTDANPTVTYNTHGVYDVTQIVSDGTTTDTLEMEDYITAMSIPAQASTPSGSGDPCQNSSPQYSTDPVTYASTYTWTVEPGNAGSFSGNGTTATLNLSQTYTGTINIKVRAENECGDGAWSNVLTSTVRATPTIYNITAQGTGAYCEGTSGTELILDGSETGVEYELFLDDVSTGVIVSGTGDVISFGTYTEEGIYTAMGATDYCSMDMSGSTWVHMISVPGTPGTPAGNTAVCSDNDSTSYTTSGASDANYYTWTLSPENAGEIIGTDVDAYVDWDDSFSGLAEINVMGSNECGDGPVSDNIEVNVYAIPDPAISGETLVCEFWEGIVYTTANHPDNTYSWEIEGGIITDGAGTSEVTVDWGAAGNGWLRVTEVTPEACEKTTEDYGVTIDDCTAIEELDLQHVSIYPNPAREELFIEFERELNESFTVRIMDLTGKSVAVYNETASNGLIRINISELKKGLYSIELSNQESGRITQRLIKN